MTRTLFCSAFPQQTTQNAETDMMYTMFCTVFPGTPYPVDTSDMIYLIILTDFLFYHEILNIILPRNS